MSQSPVVIVGAGLAGLQCARLLHERGLAVRVLEAAEDVGGRVRTDEVEGFRLDRGFQVLLTAYPACREAFDYEALRLRRFEPGALVYADGRLQRLDDPFARPGRAVQAALSRVMGPMDKFRLARLRARSRAGSLEALWQRPEATTAKRLQEMGFSSRAVERFLRPFYGGVFLERELATSSRFLAFVTRFFAEGATAVPAEGMGALPAQIAPALPAEAISCRTRVEAVEQEGVRRADGGREPASAVVVATDASQAQRLLPQHVSAPARKGTVCLYFAAARAPTEAPMLALDGAGEGPINHAAVMSNVAPELAPSGAVLISASTVGVPEMTDEQLAAQARAQLGRWFGAETRNWRLLRAVRVPDALPDQQPPLPTEAPTPRVTRGLFVCGDHRANASLHGALESGRRAAEAVVHDTA